MDDEEEKEVDIVDGQGADEKDSILSGIPRPMSHSMPRPPSRPAPSARVRALGKEELDDVDQNSEEEDEEEEDDEEDDEDQGIQVEGARLFRTVLHRPHLDRRPTRWDRDSLPGHQFLNRERLLPRRINDDRVSQSSASSSFSLSNSSSRNEMLNEDILMKVQEFRDLCYFELPYSSKRAYDPADFEHLQVSSEMKELFQYITRYTPQNIDLDTKLRPFIPEFIPAVGDIDAFIKVPRPDSVVDKLGLIALDEPCAKQSDPTVLDLQLRAISKETTFKSVAVKSLENADKRPKEIDAWINSISNLHRSKPPPTVHYSRNMPDIEPLMQEWPPEFEEALNKFGIPSAELDCSLEEYVELLCGIMDIPVYRSKIQSLHVLFTLFLEFRNSQHFRSLAMDNEYGDAQKSESHANGTDHLVIRD
ncbi:intraflagellar transport protein 46 homolog [Nephila pilipes]|uniref:Intraflagellar transport protein 46 homolog n=1 Tax=Nephila pilipes TaxID=299642 RepID=A0A8X6NA42_NEPPI|nr:intraflagellar transport protein 46 homolog [Nephila pilipes]